MTTEFVTTDRVVLKWVVPVNDDWHPVGVGPVVGVGVQTLGTLCVWTLENVDETKRKVRHARVYGTGMALPPRGEVVGMAFDGAFVWHLVRSYLEPLSGMTDG